MAPQVPPHRPMLFMAKPGWLPSGVSPRSYCWTPQPHQVWGTTCILRDAGVHSKSTPHPRQSPGWLWYPLPSHQGRQSGPWSPQGVVLTGWSGWYCFHAAESLRWRKQKEPLCLLSTSSLTMGLWRVTWPMVGQEHSISYWSHF